MPQPAAVIQGTLDLLILKALSLSPMHGWGISHRIREISGGAFQVGQGSLYPALHRFETRDWVTSYWFTTANNRMARFYALTSRGHRALQDEIAAWRRYVAAVSVVIGAE